jgi:hypothetical protein|tara:strand:+ start:141 stop:602 length:462 start_codon:yes stop_codon:yes gene_type:complete
MKKATYDYSDVVTMLNIDGIMEEPDTNWILEYIVTEYGGNLDNTSSWAQGSEGLLVYTETTADSYDVYACTSDHNGPRDFGSDIFYYCDGAEFAERILDTLCNYQNVWVADHVWDEIEDDVECALAEWWSDIYEDLHQDKVNMLTDEGHEYEE